MTTDSPTTPLPDLDVAPAPHVVNRSLTTRRMMFEVLLAMLPIVLAAIWNFQLFAVKQLAVCIGSALVAEFVFMTLMRRRPLTLLDGSAAVTGTIIALSLPAGAPWFVGVIASIVGIGVGKIVYGGLGQNMFNPAMVGRAFVMIAFGTLVGGSVYQVTSGGVPEILTHATPLSAAKSNPGSWPAVWQSVQEMFLWGNRNGSLGETWIPGIVLGGVYLCVRRIAAWEIPLAVLGSLWLVAGITNWLDPQHYYNAYLHLSAGAAVFGAFFIATDPATSPLTFRGKVIFGVAIGLLTWVIRVFSGYPEGFMFAVLILNAFVPLLNRWTIPTPVGGPGPARK